jgi:hypothetical protein
MMVSRSRLVLFGFLFFLFFVFSARPGQAEPVPLPSAFSLISDGGLATVEFAGSDAGYDSVLFLAGPHGDGPFFPNHSTAVGTTASLGTFAAGTELVFRLHVFTTGEDFFTGAGSRNPDGMVHAVASPWSGTPGPGVRVAFEDLRGGGDGDFNDFQFAVSHVRLVSSSPVPEPATLLLFATGAAAIGGRAWRQRRRRAVPAL